MLVKSLRGGVVWVEVWLWLWWWGRNKAVVRVQGVVNCEGI